MNDKEHTSFVTRCCVDSYNMEIGLGNVNDNAMLLKYEKVTAVLEFAVNSLIMHVSPTDLLIAHNW